MTWHAIVDADANLISTGEVIATPEELAANGYTALPLDGDPSGLIWDAATKTFSAPPSPLNSYATWDWLHRFTADEIAAIRASQDRNVQALLFRLQFAPTVVPQSAEIQQGLLYLASMGLIAPDRVVVIGAN